MELPGYDTWLNAPLDRVGSDEGMIEAYCEATGADPETATYEEAYEYYQELNDEKRAEAAEDRKLFPEDY